MLALEQRKRFAAAFAAPLATRDTPLRFSKLLF
jgi:hypothetical protein